MSTLEGVLSQPLLAVGMRACMVSNARHTDDTQAEPLPRARARPTLRERMLTVTPQSNPTSSHQQGGRNHKITPTHTLAPSWFWGFFKGRLHILIRLFFIYKAGSTYARIGDFFFFFGRFHIVNSCLLILFFIRQVPHIVG